MNTLIDGAMQIPLAQRDAWESLGNRFSGDHAEFNWGDLVALAGVILAIGALVWLLRWLYGMQQARRLSNEPRHLFADLCKAHRLDRRDRKRLELLSQQLDLATPATLFVRPDLFDQRGLLAHAIDEQETIAYARLSDKLFAGLDALQPALAPTPAEPSFDDSVNPAPVAPVVDFANLPSATISINQD